MKRHKYKSYQEYLNIQYQTNEKRIQWTLDKADLRANDISNIKSVFTGKRCLCLGCRHDAEVDDFIKNGYDALGIDILPTERQIQGDINKLEDYFEEGSFDIAYSCHSLEHTNNPFHFLSMIRKICCEGLYLVIPIRKEPDIEEPIFFNVMHSRNVYHLNELKRGLGTFEVKGQWIRDDATLPSGAEIAFALKWT